MKLKLKLKPKTALFLGCAMMGAFPAGVALAANTVPQAEIAAACSYDQSNPMMASEVNYEPMGCSGTILARADGDVTKTLILTAHHCFPNNQIQNNQVNITVHFLAGGQCVQSADLLPAADVALASWTGTAKVLVDDTANAQPAPGLSGKDVTLLEIDTPAPAGTYYAGWDSSPIPAEGLTATSINYSARLQATTASGTYALDVFNNGKLNFTSGQVVPGASGSAVFNSSGNVIAHANGVDSEQPATASQPVNILANSLNQYYAELKPYLDPQNTGVTSTSGYPAPTPPSITITAAPASITVGQSATVSWSVTHAATCTASGSDPTWTGNKALSGSLTVTPTGTGFGHPAVLVDESSDPVDEVSDLVDDFNPWSTIPRTR